MALIYIPLKSKLSPEYAVCLSKRHVLFHNVFCFSYTNPIIRAQLDLLYAENCLHAVLVGPKSYP